MLKPVSRHFELIQSAPISLIHALEKIKSIIISLLEIERNLHQIAQAPKFFL
jgi:hypothetical protein